MPNETRVPSFAPLKAELRGSLFDDLFARGRYATDASIYQMMPHAVVVPETLQDVEATLAFARREGLAVLPRGGGTSQCGQTVNNAIVIDASRHLNRILELDVDARRCLVEPGIVLDELNRQLKPHGLWFPVDVSTSSRATIGGMAGNNSCGGRSIRYGMMRDNVTGIEAIMSDGTKSWFGDVAAAARVARPLARGCLAGAEEVVAREAQGQVAQPQGVLLNVVFKVVAKL